MYFVFLLSFQKKQFSEVTLTKIKTQNKMTSVVLNGTLSLGLFVLFCFEIGSQVAQASFKFPNIQTVPRNW